MCFVVFSYRQHPRYRLVLATNRDEFYARPTAPAAFWEDAPSVLAGRDLKGGGTWMGISKCGKFAAVTNYRSGKPPAPNAKSRGQLTREFLLGSQSPEQYLQSIAAEAEEYSGFNLLLGDRQGLYYFSNRGGKEQRLPPGIYGLSNDLLDTPWPKVISGKQALRTALETSDSRQQLVSQLIFTVLGDTEQAADSQLPDTGLAPDLERALSPRFIHTENYGTRASTTLIVDAQQPVHFTEHQFAAGFSSGLSSNKASPQDRDSSQNHQSVSYSFTLTDSGSAED